MKTKFNVGDKVDYVNDFGVVFTGHTITELDIREDEIRYFIDIDCSWVSIKEKNLHPAGTYNPESLDLKLCNGMIAKFSHYDYWCNRVYVIENDGQSLHAVLLNGGTLYSISDYDEPISPLGNQLQPENRRQDNEKK